ncbi:uncharacterized protein SPPG_07144 [Spizellomyces punctatus DAOM BR117]|uniref:L-2-hydroxyglutarate dehydrogenase, mitochondrial n=1 Tax=Spizellomyces punctatus (strain DAOM BR117) TaxID=645134 RepID=A0A0L0H826_SPIPD|nr:uncharacterized protein SPPG_07144 [Spizellomyces punctatus DAOM BR117]KNC97680.1 hypothetical protein SPPG_07144 [Spizellomyces punctatus DAOM BR117]|eukprot:XP_016605720.1 hypothetical protein SPPG_07144 [Spizellomyces punctatus DAOM BR117]
MLPSPTTFARVLPYRTLAIATIAEAFSVSRKSAFSTTTSGISEPELCFDNVIIGAGVVGLAIAERLSRQPKTTTLVLERHASFGMETSSRNSEVIHAGIYYPVDSLKTRLCTRGNRLLYSFCSQHSIRHARIGKWVIGSEPDQFLYLKNMKDRAEKLGVPMHFLSMKEAAHQEPNVIAKEVLVSPTTGIIDSHALMECLEAKIQSRGADVVYHTSVISISATSSGYRIRTSDTPPTIIHARNVINSAGLYADAVAAMIAPTSPYRIYPCKGVYYTFAGRCPPVKRLIYPTPEKNLQGLGVHSTVDLAGRVKFGPNAFYVNSKEDVGVQEDEAMSQQFAEAVSKYLRRVKKEDLRVDYAGIRPKLSGPGDPFHDFVIESSKEHPGFINLLGIESPGLTSSLAIAEHVEKMLGYDRVDDGWDNI